MGLWSWFNRALFGGPPPEESWEEKRPAIPPVAPPKFHATVKIEETVSAEPAESPVRIQVQTEVWTRGSKHPDRRKLTTSQTTVGKFLRDASIIGGYSGAEPDSVFIKVNGETVAEDEMLQEGDFILVYPVKGNTILSGDAGPIRVGRLGTSSYYDDDDDY